MLESVSEWKQKEHSDVVERGHLQRLVLVAKVLFIYFYYEIKDVFRHITVSLGSKTVSCFGTTKGCR